MEVIKQTSPFIRKKEANTARIMVDVLIALLPVVAFAILSFGIDGLIRILSSVLVMVGLEILSVGLIKTPREANSKGPLPGSFFTRFKARYSNLKINHFLTPTISGIIYAMLIPSQLPIYAVIVGAVFGIVLGKLVFGGFGQNIFNPAALGRIFIGLSFGSQFNSAYTGTSLSTGATPLGGDFNTMIGQYSLLEMFTGNIPGSMGEICKIAILIGAAYLLIRRAADFRVMVSTLASFSIMILFAGLAMAPNNPFQFLLYHLLSGGILFGAVYMATDPVTSPITRPGRFIYGALIGILTAAIRIFGAYPEGMAFSILIMNMFVPLIDYYKWATNKYNWKFAVIMGVMILGFIPLFFFAAGGEF